MTITRHFTTDRVTIIVDGVPLQDVGELEQDDAELEADQRTVYMQSITDAWKTSATDREGEA